MTTPSATAQTRASTVPRLQTAAGATAPRSLPAPAASAGAQSFPATLSPGQTASQTTAPVADAVRGSSQVPFLVVLREAELDGCD